MKEMILLKCGELVLKGLNRSRFEDKLVSTVRHRLSGIGEFNVEAMQSTVYIEPVGDADIDRAFSEVQYIFGVTAISRAAVCEKDIEKIKETAIEYLASVFKNKKTFKVEAKRADKRFPMKSPEICMEVGGYLDDCFENISVDVHSPDVVVMVEIRERYAFVHAGKVPGAGGMPVGSNGRAALLLSGGIDSPVAGHMIAKRGISLIGIHFESPPYTSKLAHMKVERLSSIMTRYCGDMSVAFVPFTDIQQEIREKCMEDYFTLVMRRFMMRIAEKIAEDNGCGALVTGESLGQVASQTMEAIGVTESVIEMPVLRPVIGMDKEEIVAVARKIGTFDVSIEPYEDCCTVFTPRHPQTKPKKHQLEKVEKALDIENMCLKALEGVTWKKISQNDMV